MLAGICFYIWALKFGRLDIAVLISLYPCGIIILAWFILKERILLSQGGGIIAALIASILFTVWQLDKRCYF